MQLTDLQLEMIQKVIRNDTIEYKGYEMQFQIDDKNLEFWIKDGSKNIEYYKCRTKHILDQWISIQKRKYLLKLIAKANKLKKPPKPKRDWSKPSLIGFENTSGS